MSESGSTCVLKAWSAESSELSGLERARDIKAVYIVLLKSLKTMGSDFGVSTAMSTLVPRCGDGKDSCC